MLALAASAASAATFTVNSNADVHDANPGDGICETVAGNHICTLRAAVEEANALPGADTITLQANATYTLSLVSSINSSLKAGLLIVDSVAINGAGAASTIIDGNGGVTGQHVLQLLPCIGNVTNMTGGCVNGGVIASMSGLTIKNGIGPNIAGGISNGATLTLDSVAVTDNAADGINDWGGGIYSFGTLTINNCIIANNRTGASNAYGGGIYSQGPLTITNSTISGNSTPGYGGGLYLVFKGATIRNSTISGNQAGVGGGIDHATIQPLVLINDTISGNSSNGDGGGVYNTSGPVGLYNATVTQNRANADGAGFANGGGLANAANGTLTITDTIVAGNQVVIPTLPQPTLDVDECSGTITNQGYNIIEFPNLATCTVGGAYSTADPQLGVLQLNGGFTQTHAISPGSSAIDMGNPTGCTDDTGATITSDQRGIHRPYGSACDIGAFEYADIIFRNGFQP